MVAKHSARGDHDDLGAIDRRVNHNYHHRSTDHVHKFVDDHDRGRTRAHDWRAAEPVGDQRE